MLLRLLRVGGGTPDGGFSFPVCFALREKELQSCGAETRLEGGGWGALGLGGEINSSWRGLRQSRTVAMGVVFFNPFLQAVPLTRMRLLPRTGIRGLSAHFPLWSKLRLEDGPQRWVCEEGPSCFLAEVVPVWRGRVLCASVSRCSRFPCSPRLPSTQAHRPLQPNSTALRPSR